METESVEDAAASKRRRWRRGLPWFLFAVAVIAGLVARRVAPWIPIPYLVVLLGTPFVPWVWHRLGRGTLLTKRAITAVAVVIVIALLPLPWQTALLDHPPGTTWRLDGRVSVDGEVMDPPGEWYWLTVGRPPIVAEVVWAGVRGEQAAIDLRDGIPAIRPEVAEPAAARVALQAVGDPRALGNVDVVVGGWWATTPLGSWWRGLALGRSHGLMVALVTYAHVSGEDLAAGRRVAGTGAIDPDGAVVRIGGLLPKARAAESAGIDVFVFPASQLDELDGFVPSDMVLVPVADFADALDGLRRTAAESVPTP